MEERQNRIAEALKIRGLKKIELAEKSGIHKGTISNWINQKYQPKQNSLYIMARILRVSEMWLGGYDVPMERSTQQIEADKIAEYLTVLKSTRKYDEIVEYVIKLDDTQLEVVTSMIKGLTSNKEV